MAFRFDPRGDLPPPTIQPSSYAQPRSNFTIPHARYPVGRFSSLSLSSKPRIKPCYDWIFSSASNVHVALDKSAFKDYTTFDSYVLTLSDHRQVHVKGIGSVELKIKHKPGSRESHTILLSDVLHIPSWLCNIFSDVYFDSGHNYEHSWTESGVQFCKRENDELRPWGYTENFCSLDRLVLAKHHKDARSPMLEDRDREVFSINIAWPQSQRDRWEVFLDQQQGGKSFHALPESGSLLVVGTAGSDVQRHFTSVKTGTVPRRATLSDINANIVTQAPSRRISSLKATTGGKNLSKEAA